jgi:histidine triad (HIT) family protein
MEDCLFCKIVAGDIPATEVASSERTFAFRDISPAAPVHVLVVPKTHITNAAEVTAEHADIVAELLVQAGRIAEQEGIADSGYRLVFNVGEDAQNSVPHLHLHVMGGRKMGWPPG